MLPVMKEATEAGIPVATYAWGYVTGPGTNYLTVVGEDTCKLGKAFAYVMNTQVKSGNIAFLGGFPGNPLSQGWQKCEQPALNPNIQVVANEPTNWDPSKVQQVVAGILAKYPDIKGWSYEYGGGMAQGAVAAYKAAGIPFNTVLTLRTDDVGMGCTSNELKNPNLKMYYYTSGNTQIRVAFTAAMMKLKGAKIPPHDRLPDPAAEPGGARLVRQGLSAAGLRDVAHPAEPAPPDVPLGGMENHEPELETRCRVPGPSAPRAVRFAACRRRSERCRRSATSASTAAPARSTRSSGRTGPGNRHCSGSRAASSTRRGRRRDRRPAIAGAAHPAEARRLGLGMAYQTYSHVLDLSVAENLYLAVPADEQPTYGRMEEWAAAKLDGVRARRPADGGRRGRCRSPSGSSSRSSRRCSPGRRCCSSTSRRPRSGRRTSSGSTRSCSSRAGQASASSTSATACRRCSAIADRVTVLRDGVGQGTFEAAAMSEESLVALMIGRPLQLAFPERHDQETHREVLLAVSGLRGERFGPIDLDVAKGEILGHRRRRGQRAGAVPARARRRRARGRQRRLRRQRARHALAARPAARRGRAAERRSSRRVALSGPERARQHDDPGAAAARAPRAS